MTATEYKAACDIFDSAGFTHIDGAHESARRGDKKPGRIWKQIFQVEGEHGDTFFFVARKGSKSARAAEEAGIHVYCEVR